MESKENFNHRAFRHLGQKALFSHSCKIKLVHAHHVQPPPHSHTHSLSLSLSKSLVFFWYFSLHKQIHIAKQIWSQQDMLQSVEEDLFLIDTPQKNVFDENVEESRSTHRLRLHETDSSHFEKNVLWLKQTFVSSKRCSNYNGWQSFTWRRRKIIITSKKYIYHGSQSFFGLWKENWSNFFPWQLIGGSLWNIAYARLRPGPQTTHLSPSFKSHVAL